MSVNAPIFDTIRSDYLDRVAGLDAIEKRCSALGISWKDDCYHIPFFNRHYTITVDAIIDEARSAPHHAISVILCQYLLRYRNAVTADDRLVTYKDFRDAGPYAGGFKETTERPIASGFSGDVQRLERRCRKLGGRPFDTDVTCELAFQLRALPRVPIVLLFHDADEDFPAQSTLLFRKDTAAYLDMECVAMVGSTLASWLQDR